MVWDYRRVMVSSWILEIDFEVNDPAHAAAVERGF